MTLTLNCIKTQPTKYLEINIPVNKSLSVPVVTASLNKKG